MTLDNMTGITKGSYTGFCKSQLITCNRVNECNGVCPFEDALKHADKTQTMNEQHTVDHDRDWIIGCIKHDGFIKTDRFDKANQIILDALSADAVWIPCSERLPKEEKKTYWVCTDTEYQCECRWTNNRFGIGEGEWGWSIFDTPQYSKPIAWKPLQKPYKGGDDE